MVEVGKESPARWENLSAPGQDIGEGHVSMEMRRADGADEALAETQARANIAQIVDGKIMASTYALERISSTEWAEAIRNKDVDLWTGIGYQIFAVELAMIVGSAIKGVDVDGEPATWNRRSVSLLLRARIPGAEPILGMRRLGSTFASSFLSIAMAPLREARTEGKP